MINIPLYSHLITVWCILQDNMAMLRDCIATELEAGQVQARNFETMLPLSNANRQFMPQCPALVQHPVSDHAVLSQSK